MTATAADVVSETTLATMARDARGLAIDSISAVGTLVWSAFEQVRRHSKILFLDPLNLVTLHFAF